MSALIDGVVHMAVDHPVMSGIYLLVMTALVLALFWLFRTNRKLSDSRRHARELARDYERLVSRVPAGLYELMGGPDGRRHLTFASDRFLELLGLDRDTVRDDFRAVLARVHPDDRQQMIDLNAEVIGSGGSYETESRIMRPDGDRRVRVEAHPDLRPDGQVVWSGVVTDITRRREAEQKLARREALLASMGRLARAGGWQYDPGSGEVRWTDEIFHILDLPVEDTPQLDDILAFYHPRDRRRLERAMQRAVEHGEPYDLELSMTTAGGREILVRTVCEPQIDDGRVGSLLGAFQDITRLRETERELREAQARFRTIFEQSPIGMLIHDAQSGEVLDANGEGWREFGYSSLEELKAHASELWTTPPHSWDEALAAIRRAASGHTQTLDWPSRRRNGELFWQQVKLSPLSLDGRQCVLASCIDVTDRKRHEAELHRVANYDPLTGLPNRRMLIDLLRRTISRAARHDESFAVCYLDLDEFKPINDEFGHATGDKVLIEIGRRLGGVVRQSDTVARLGGDEFVVLLDSLERHESLQLALRRILRAAREVIVVDGLELQVSASIGVTTFPADASDADTLLRHADQAMYRAKDMGRNRYCLFDTDLQQKSEERARQLRRITNALEGGQFHLHYQPKVNMETGDVVGFEALVRWQDPERGVVPPSDFLRLIEHSDLEERFGWFVLDEALAQARRWSSEGLHFAVSVNVSGQNLLRAGFVDGLRQALERQPDVAPSDLEIEILETAAVTDLDAAVAVLERVRALGVRVSLDDFGVGYSSLAHLRWLPIDALKIDRSFVRDMLTDYQDFSIVKSVLGMARAFDMELIAEGVETDQHASALVGMGCRLGQGYAFARPMPAAEVPDWYRRWREKRPWKRTDTRALALAMDQARELAAAHMRWLEQVEHTVRSGSCPDGGPELDPQRCAMGMWLTTMNRGPSDHPPRLIARIDRQHERLHRIARRQCDQVSAGHRGEAVKGLPELRAESARLLELVESLPAVVQEAEK